jgi:hypothetical protein
MEVVRFLQGLILTLEKAWHSLQGMPGWSPGTLGMGW